MPRLSAILLGVMLCYSTANAAPLSDVVRQVLRDHPNIQTSQALLNAADEQLKQAKSNYFPTVGIDSFLKDSKDKQSNVFGVTNLDRSAMHTEAYVRWNIFRGMSDKQTVKSSEFKRRAADADLAEAHEQVALQVTETYLELLRMQRLLDLVDSYSKELEKLAEQMREREEAGRVSKADLEQVRMNQVQIASQRASLRGQMAGIEQRYQLLTGSAPNNLTEPTIDDAAASMGQEALNARVLVNNRSVRAAMERAAAQAEEVGVAKGALFPSLDMELRKRLHTKDEPAWVTDTQRSTQVSLSYQLPLGGSTFSRKREAEDRRWAAQAAAETELLRVRSELATRWASWQEMRNITPKLRERVESGVRVIDAYEAQYEAARRSLMDLISSRGEHFRAQAELISNRIDQISTSAQVLSLLGELRESLLGSSIPLARPTSTPTSAPIEEIILNADDFVIPIPKNNPAEARPTPKTSTPPVNATPAQPTADPVLSPRSEAVPEIELPSLEDKTSALKRKGTVEEANVLLQQAPTALGMSDNKHPPRAPVKHILTAPTQGVAIIRIKP